MKHILLILTLLFNIFLASANCDTYFDIKYDVFYKKNIYTLKKSIIINQPTFDLELKPDMQTASTIPRIELKVYGKKNNGFNTTGCFQIIFLFEDESTYKLNDYSFNQGHFIDLNRWQNGAYYFSYVDFNTCCNSSQMYQLEKLKDQFYSTLSSKKIKAIRFVNMFAGQDVDYEFKESEKDYFMNVYKCYRN